jgi:ABC-type phosphate/phosphonate transport system permease subunit
MTVAKMTLALIAAILFGFGVRTESAPLRWAAIAFLSAAVLLRFIDSRRSR